MKLLIMLKFIKICISIISAIVSIVVILAIILACWYGWNWASKYLLPATQTVINLIR